MEEWKEYKLGEVCTELSDGLHKAPKFKMGGDYIFVNAKNIFGGFVIDNDPSKKSTYEEYLKYSSPLNDTTILYSIDGTIGNVALYRGEKCILGKGACYMNPNPQVLDRMFLYYELQSPRFKSYIDKMSTGSTIKHISLKTMRGYNFTFPSLETQRQISSILKSLDDKIETNRRINDNLEAQAQALFKSWFVDFEPFRDGEFVESELGMIPKGWRVGTLDEVGDVVGGSTPSKKKPEYYAEKGIAWLTPKDLSISHNKFTSRGEIDITIEGYNSCSTKLMPKGSVLFSSRAPIGYITIAKNEICTNQGFKSVIPKIAGTAFLYYFLKKSTSEIENKATGSTFKEASGSLMKSFPLVIAPKKIMERFEELVKPILNQQEELEDESSRLATLRDTLLPRLMSGELKVNEIEREIQ
ncbi:MAG: restriction endonuclease subunit S [Bacteroidaceae bacterium]|nr:restriction endonuclease subunit S [Bacteroidaceae bacterium]